MKVWQIVLALLLLQPATCGAEVILVARLFADAHASETFLLVDDTRKINESKGIELVSKDGRYKERHGIQHLLDGRYIHLTGRLARDFISGARIYQVE